MHGDPFTMKLSLLAIALACVSFVPLSGHAAIVVDPAQPTPSDEVGITISGVFSNPCFEIATSQSVEADQIEIDVAIKPVGELCIQVVTPWSVTVTLDQLPAGSYDAVVNLSAPCCVSCGSSPCSEFASFSVLEAPAGGDECGGIQGLTCSETDQFCMTELGECCCDFIGTCTPIPEVCTDNFDPVCGCDGRTYSNACTAAAAGISIDSNRSCDEPICPAPCSSGQECFSGSGVLVAGVECVLFQDGLGGLYVVNSGGRNVGDPVSITGCLDRSCVSSCQQGNGCIQGTLLVPEPSGHTTALIALSTLLILRRARGTLGLSGSQVSILEGHFEGRRSSLRTRSHSSVV